MSCPICSDLLHSTSANYSKFKCNKEHYEIYYKPIDRIARKEIKNANELEVIAERIIGPFASIYIDHKKQISTIQYDHKEPTKYCATLNEALDTMKAWEIASDQSMAATYSKLNNSKDKINETN